MNKVKNKTVLYFGAFLFFISFVNIDAQNAQAQDSAKAKQSKKQEIDTVSLLTLKVDKKKSFPITLNARNVSVAEITKELARHYKISFALSKTVSNYKPALDLPHSTIEDVLKRLAPLVILEKEIAGRSIKPTIRGAYLYAHNEVIPTMDGKSLANNQVLVFEGNTETGINEDSKSPIFFKYEKGKLSARAKNQPVILIAGRIADELGIPLTLVSESNETININIKNLSPQQSFIHLPRSLKLIYRLHLSSMETEYVEIVLDGNSKAN